MAEFVQEGGRWVLKGQVPTDTVVAPPQAPKAPAPVQAQPAQPRPKGFWGQLWNDLEYEAKATFMGGRAGAARAAKNAVTYPGRLWMLQHSAIAEIQRNGIEAIQTLRGQRGDYATTRVGAFIDRNEELLYRNLGLTPPSQQQGTEALLTGFGTEAAAQVGMAAVGGAALSKAARVAPFLRPVQNALNPAAGKTALGKVGRFVGAAVADEAATTPFVNNTGGSAVSLVNMVLGTNFRDPVTPEMNRLESMRAGIIPNTAFSLLAGGGLMAGTGAIGRFRRARTETTRQTRARERLQQQGVTVADPDTGAQGFANERPTWRDVEREMGIEEDAPAPEAPAAPELPPPAQDVGTLADGADILSQPEAMAEPGGALVPTRPIDPMAMDELPPWATPYDPRLPEADTLLRVIDEVLEPDEIVELAQGKGPVIEQIEDLVAGRQQAEINPDRTFENSAAPRASLSEGYLAGYRDQLEAMNPEELRDLALNSPEVSIKTTEVTGKAPEEFTKADVIEGLLAIPDQAVLANRVAGRQLSPMLPVDEIEVDAQRFQFKGDTDEAGVQAGNSLEGVERWNPDAEGLIQVWADPANGRTYVVNGHNRLAKARGLGVPTMRVTYLNARTAEQARAMGAMANIAEGGGTAFDAAKFLRESGVTSTKQLKELGANLSDQRNLWVPGLALSKLPEDTFLMAVNGTLDLGDAVMIGKSGLSPETMGEVAKVAVRRGWTGEKLAEMLAQGDATRATAKGADQVDLFGNAETVNTQELKADLAIRVRALLRADRNAFRSVSRNAEKLRKGNNVIDEATSGGIADGAAQALKTFDRIKYETSRVSDLLNEGVRELAGGAQLEPIAARIARETPAAIELEMGGGQRAQGGSQETLRMTPEEKPAAPAKELEALEQEITASAEQLQTWEALPQVKRDTQAKEARKWLLTDRKRANRLEKKAKFDAMYEEVLEGIGRPEGPPEGVTVPDKGVANKLEKELKMDAWAQSYLAWYDQQPPVRLKGGQLEKAKAALVGRAIDADEVRPPATPIPDELPVPDPNLQAAADELSRNEVGPAVQEMVGTELALREAFDAQDVTARTIEAQAERIETGFDFKPLEDVRAEVVETFLDPEPVPARPIRAASEPKVEPAVALDALIDQSRVTIRVTKAEADYLRSVFINPDDFAEMPLRDAQAMLETIPNEAGAPRRLRKKLDAQVQEAGLAAAEAAMDQMPTPEPMPSGSIADAFAAVGRAMAQSDARLYRGLGESLQQIRSTLDELDGGGTVDVQVREVRKALPAGKAGQPAKKALAKARSEALKWQLPSELSRMSGAQKNAIMDSFKAAPSIWPGKKFVAPWDEDKWARFVADTWETDRGVVKNWGVFDLADGPNGKPVEVFTSSRYAADKAAGLNRQGLQQAREVAEKALAPYREAAEVNLRDTAAQVADEQVANIDAEIQATKQRAMEDGC